MSLLCPHLIHLWRPWQGIGKSPRRQVALKRHSTQGTEISLDDIDAEFARDNHCLTLCMYILCIYNVARASGNAQCACSCIYYACTCTYVHVHIPNVLVILYGRSAAIFPTDTQISRFPHYDSRIQSRVTHTRPKCLVQQPHILGQNVVYLSTVYTSSSERASRGPTMKDTYLSRCLWCVRCLRQGIPWRQDPQNSHFRVARTREVLGTRRWWRLRVDAGHKAKSMPLCACVCVCVGMEFVYTYTQCIHTQVCVCVCVCVCIYVCVVYTQNTESGATACINSRPSTSTSAATSHGYSIITANGTLMFLRWPPRGVYNC